MKAVILERRGRLAAVLAENGAFLKARCSGSVGEEIELGENAPALPVGNRKRVVRTAIAASLALVILGGSYHAVAASPCAYISLDTGENAVEISVNRLGRVIAVSPVTTADAELARTLNGELKGEKTGDALRKAVSAVTETTADADPELVIVAGVTAKSEKRSKALTETVENAAASQGEELLAVEVSPEERKEALAREKSGGRYVIERGEEALSGNIPEITETRAEADGGEEAVPEAEPVREPEKEQPEGQGAVFTFVPEEEPSLRQTEPDPENIPSLAAEPDRRAADETQPDRERTEMGIVPPDAAFPEEEPILLGNMDAFVPDAHPEAEDGETPVSEVTPMPEQNMRAGVQTPAEAEFGRAREEIAGDFDEPLDPPASEDNQNPPERRSDGTDEPEKTGGVEYERDRFESETAGRVPADLREFDSENGGDDMISPYADLSDLRSAEPSIPAENPAITEQAETREQTSAADPSGEFAQTPLTERGGANGERTGFAGDYVPRLEREPDGTSGFEREYP